MQFKEFSNFLKLGVYKATAKGSLNNKNVKRIFKKILKTY